MTQKKNAYIVVLALLTIVVVVFWKYIGANDNTIPPQDQNIIAISTVGGDMNSTVSDFFGRAPFFVIYNITNGSSSTIDNPFIDNAHASGLQTGELLVAKGVGTVICRNIGAEPLTKFNEMNIKVYIGATGTALYAVSQYAGNQLICTTKPNVPTHFGLPGQPPCPTAPGQPAVPVIDPMAKNPVAAPLNAPALAPARAPATTPAPGGTQVAFPVQNAQTGGWTVNCPKCGSSITVNSMDLTQSNLVICPNCGNKGNLAFVDQSQGYLR